MKLSASHQRASSFVAIALSALVIVTGCSRSDGTATPPPNSQPATAAQPCTPQKPAPTGSTTATITVSGTQRTYSLNIPPGYDGTSALPLVMTFHGRGSTASQQLLLTGFDLVSDKENFILVTPNAIGGQWDLPVIPGRATSDTTYITELLAALNQRLCVDSSRMYASGMSLGSAMTFALACAPEQTFAAFGGVGATFHRPVCDAAPPVPVIYFHGTADAIVPFEGGKVAGSPAGSITARVSGVNETMAAWANHDGCTGDPTVSELGDTTRTIWSSCANGVAVDYYRVNGGGHTWPGASQLVADFTEERLGKTTQAVDASALMWDFFSQYQLPAREQSPTR